MTCLSGRGSRPDETSAPHSTGPSVELQAELTGGPFTGLPEPTVSPPERLAVEAGSRVRVRDADGEHEYTIVERLTAGVRPGSISVASPVGRALVGHRQGDRLEVQTPGGVRRLTVLAVTVPQALPSPRSPRPCEA